MGEYTVCYWPCWPEPRPKAQRPPTRLAREVRSLGEQRSDSQGQYGPGVSASRAAIPERNRSAHLPSCVRSGFAFWASAPGGREVAVCSAGIPRLTAERGLRALSDRQPRRILST